MICYVDGNIASGKSTVLKELSRRGYATREERVDDWEPFLSLYYDDPARWAFALEVAIAAHRATNVNDKVVFIERSPECNAAFTELRRRSEYLDDAEYDLIASLNESANEPVGRAYYRVDVDVETCLKRIKKRARPGEAAITADYLDAVNRSRPTRLDYVVVDGNRSPSLIADDVLRHLKTIRRRD